MAKIIGTPIKKQASFRLATPLIHVTFPYHVSALGLNGTKGSDFRYLLNHPIEYSRNFLAENFLKENKNDYLLFADSDSVFVPDAAIRLMERNLPVVCGVFFTRTFPIVPTMGMMVKPNIYHFGNMASVIYERMKDKHVDGSAVILPKEDDDLMEIDGCGMHFTMIRRDVLERLTPPFFQCTQDNAGEDFYFCRKAKEAGFKIYADLSLYIGHAVGESTIHGLQEFMMASEGMLDKFKEWEVAV